MQAFQNVIYLELEGSLQATCQNFPVSAKKTAGIPSCKLHGIGRDAAGNVPGIILPRESCLLRYYNRHVNTYVTLQPHAYDNNNTTIFLGSAA